MPCRDPQPQMGQHQWAKRCFAEHQHAAGNRFGIHGRRDAGDPAGLPAEQPSGEPPGTENRKRPEQCTERSGPKDRRIGAAIVTLQLTVRMRRFAGGAAAYLRIIWREIIKYAAITITPRIAGTPSVVDVNSLKCAGFREPCGAVSMAKGTSISAHEIRSV